MFKVISAICLIGHFLPSLAVNPALETALKAANVQSISASHQAANFIRNAIEKKDHLPNVPTREVGEKDVAFLLFTRNNTDKPYEFVLDDHVTSSIKQSTFNPEKPVLLYVDGYNFSSSLAIPFLPQGILPVNDVNVIILNWDSYNFFDAFYTVSVTLQRLGSIVAKFVHELITLGSDPKKIQLVGFSSGVEIISLAAKTIKPKVARILGIDPIGNYFTNLPPTERIDKSDADFVAVAHCSSGIFALPPENIYGNVTFYVNGGVYQPQCVGRTTPINFRTIYDVSYCSHIICRAAYLTSLCNNSSRSGGILCRRCVNYNNERRCNNTYTPIYGFYVPSTAEAEYECYIDGIIENASRDDKTAPQTLQPLAEPERDRLVYRMNRLFQSSVHSSNQCPARTLL